MKHKYLIYLIFILFSVTLFAEKKEIIPVELKWKGVEKSYADSLYFEFISLENARYSNRSIPSFHYETRLTDGCEYNLKIENPSYIKITSEELNLLEGRQFSSEPTIETYISEYRNEKKFHIEVTPFVEKENEIFKLLNFDLNIETTKKTIAKAAGGNKYSYSSSSILSQGMFVKFRIEKSGVYKITYEELRAKGIEPGNVRIFGYGGAVLEENFSISKHRHDDLPEIAIYDSGSYILFYGEGIRKCYYDEVGKFFVHKNNPYSHYGYYFITSSNVGEKRRIQQAPAITPSIVNDVYHFTDFQVYEKDIINIGKSGKEFYDDKMKPASTKDISFNFPNARISEKMKVNIDLGAKSSSGSNFSLSLNNTFIKNIPIGAVSGYYNFNIKNDKFEVATPGDALTFKLVYNSGNNAAEGYFNYISVNATRELIMNGGYMLFHNKENIGNTSVNRYNLRNTNSGTQIWNITDPVNIQQMSVNSSTQSLTFIDEAKEVKSYIAVDPASNDFLKGTLLDEVPSQNIHGMEPIDMLIITHPSFISHANKLAQAHYENDGLRVGVVTTEEVYNEFSSGKPDATAYRWAAKMFYDKPQNQSDKLRYLLLFGKGSYDNRGIITGSGYNYTLMYQSDNSHSSDMDSFPSDDYFGLLGDDEGKKIGKEEIDIGIGRFPVISESQANDVVNKTISYMKNENRGPWKNQLCFVGDDGGDSFKTTHMRQANQLADAITQKNKEYQANKILLDAYQQEITASGESYPIAKNRMHNLIRTGVLYLNYMGHAGDKSWANEQILTNSEIKAFTNKNLSLISTGSCNFSLCDQSSFSGGEELVLNPQGGSIGSYAAARTVYAGNNFTLMKYFGDSLFNQKNGEYVRVGDAVAKSKNNTLDTNMLCYIYFGDPAIKLNYPSPYKVHITEVNGKDVTIETDTLRALSKATVKGVVADNQGNIDKNFNGTVHVLAFDKEQQLKTLDNHNQEEILYFKDRPNTLFSGKTKVVNGNFSITFMVPKSIRYNYGTGRLSLYAWNDAKDGEIKKEGQGYFEDFIVGGSSTDYIHEEEGPEVEMYLNHRGFVSGSKVNEEPLFIAHLYDINGINTSGAGIGDDIILTIFQDGIEKYRFSLNDYYESKEDSYQEGSINFRLPELESGKYTLTFRVLDLLNNSTTHSLDFEVTKGLSPVIFSVRNYPNPAVNETNIIVEHDRETIIISMTVDIFDLAGRKIWSFSHKSDEIIPWNLTKSSGEKVSPGIYIYRVSVENNDKIISSKSNKIIVNKQ